MSAAWFVDGAYASSAWQSLGRTDRIDYVKLRRVLEDSYLERGKNETIEEAYYFCATSDPGHVGQNRFFNMLAFPPPTGPGLRVKPYWLTKKPLFWPRKLGGGPVIHPQTQEQFELTQQKGVDVGLAFHLIRSYTKREWKRLFLVAGDADFHEVVQHLVENENVELTLVGSLDSISEFLRPYARNTFEFGPNAESIALAGFVND